MMKDGYNVAISKEDSCQTRYVELAKLANCLSVCRDQVLESIEV